jgi:DNA-binding protein H-NS
MKMEANDTLVEQVAEKLSEEMTDLTEQEQDYENMVADIKPTFGQKQKSIGKV